MSKFTVLLTAKPMIYRLDKYMDRIEQSGVQLIVPEFKQIVAQEELERVVPTVDLWIIGDEEAQFDLLSKGAAGKLRTILKWGVGMDAIDTINAKELGVHVENTPGVFAEEVSDVAVGYLLMLARHLHQIDRGVHENWWTKLRGISLNGKKALIIGMGSIGRAVAKKLTAFGLDLYGWDLNCTDKHPEFCSLVKSTGVTLVNSLIDQEYKFVIVCCALNNDTYHLLDDRFFEKQSKSYLINVSRGPVVDEKALVRALKDKRVSGAGLDVFEVEPLPKRSELKKYNCIFGAHNASNTDEAVDKVSNLVLDKLNTILSTSTAMD